MKTNDNRLTPAQEQFKKDMALSKMNKQSFPPVVEEPKTYLEPHLLNGPNGKEYKVQDTTRNREEMEKALDLFQRQRHEYGYFVCPQTNGVPAFDESPIKKRLDDLRFRETLPLLGDEQPEP